MNATAPKPVLLGPRTWRTFLRIAAFCALPAVVLGFLVAKDASPVGILFVALFIAAETAMAVATAHREVLAPAFTFLQPGLRNRWQRNHLAAALILGLVVATGGRLLVPDLDLPVLAGLFGMTLGVYAAFALLILWVSWAFQLPMWLYFLFYLTKPLGAAAQAGKLSPALVGPWLWIPVGAALLALLIRAAGSRGLQRRFRGAPVLVMEDIFRPRRLQEFRAHRERGQKAMAASPRRTQLLDTVLARSEAARSAGRGDAAGAWRLVFIAVAETLGNYSRRSLTLGMSVPILMVAAGYYYGANPMSELRDWFPSALYLAAVSPLYTIGLAIRQSLAYPGPRRHGYRSEALALAWATAATAVVALVQFGLFRLGAEFLPALTWSGRIIPFAAPSWHGVLVVTLLGPVVWLDTQFRPHSGACTPSIGANLVFFVGLLLLTVVPSGAAVPIYLGLVAVLTALAFWRRRRWWLAGDLPV